MLFPTFTFILGFLPVTAIVYFLLAEKYALPARIWLIAASCVFYSWFNWSYFFILAGSILVNYIFAEILYKKKSLFLFVVGILFNVLLLGYFKHKKFIDTALTGFFRKTPAEKTHALLKVSLTQALTQQNIAPQTVVNVAVEAAKKDKNHGFVNAVLRKALSELSGKGFPSAPEDVLPEILFSRWKKEFSAAQLKELTEAFSSTPEFTFRIEKKCPELTFKYSRAFCIDPAFPFGTALPGDVIGSKEFSDGMIYIQDPAASLAVSMAPAKKMERILDLCAAPGGKSLMLLEKYPEVQKFVAYDRSSKRQELTRKNFELRGIKHPVTCDRTMLEDCWDLILIDAPCSNTGVFRKRPDALWRFSREELHKTLIIQKELLDFAAAHLADNGYILYSTCSIEKDEDEDQVKDFLSRHTSFTCLESRKLLPTSGHDGAFSALLQKRPASAER